MRSKELETLQKAIDARRQYNIDGLEFVPYTWLSELLTTDQIHRILDETTIEVDERPLVANKVHDSGLRIFATLVLIGQPGLIYDFIQADGYVNKDNLDGQLPVSDLKLKDLFGVTRIKQELESLPKEKELKEQEGGLEYQRLNQLALKFCKWAEEFRSTQYMFLSPTFPQGTPHRFVSNETRLPFLRRKEETTTVKKKKNGGNFGSVYKERLPPLNYGSANDQGMRLVRKELKSSGDEVYKDELRCLRLLNPIRHSSVLQLYGSYTYEKKHNFLFREATGGDLHDLLAKDRPTEFQEDEIIYLALCGLASALDQLHDYSNDDLKLRRIGCHHDLKPRNVLVDGDKFILADFGLSTMIDASEDPKTLAQDRDTYFAAPEGMDYRTSDRHEIGPPADIWSFGCILAVVFTYMRHGPKGVERFRDQRLVEVEGEYLCFELRAFHNGDGSVNPGVVAWFADMEKEATEGAASRETGTPAEVDLINLIRDMLLIDPSGRPKTKEVLHRLRCLTLKKTCETIREDFEKSSHRKNLEFVVEGKIFLEWLRRMDQTPKKDYHFFPTDEMFTQVHNSLHSIKDELKVLANAKNDHPLFARLRRFNEKLLSSLDSVSRRSLRRVVELETVPVARRLITESALEDWVMINADSSSNFVKSEKDSKREGPNSNIFTLLAADKVRQMMNASKSPIPKLDPRDINCPLNTSPLVRTFLSGKLNSNSKESPIDIIVEEMELGPDFASADFSEQLFHRLENVVSLPSAAATFRALNCRGIYQDDNMIGLVYRYPDAVVAAAAANGTRPAAMPLAELLRKYSGPTGYVENYFVSVDDRLRLAYNLATAVFEFHKLRWVHKNISSFNILFFEDDENKDQFDKNDLDAPPHKISFGPPSLIGFSHSRQEDVNNYSNKMYSSADVLHAFHHPNYGGIDSRHTPYRTQYDYYSLGLVLLEVGLWYSLETLMDDFQDLNRSQKRDALLKKSVPFLAGAMGNVYADAVRVCLSDKLCEGGDGKLVDTRFEELVVTPLEACLAKTTSYRKQ